MSRAEVEVAMLVKAAPTVSILSPLEVKRRIRKKKKKFTKNIFIAKTDADETDSSINDTISVSKPLCCAFRYQVYANINRLNFQIYFTAE